MKSLPAFALSLVLCLGGACQIYCAAVPNITAIVLDSQTRQPIYAAFYLGSSQVGQGFSEYNADLGGYVNHFYLVGKEVVTVKSYGYQPKDVEIDGGKTETEHCGTYWTRRVELTILLDPL